MFTKKLSGLLGYEGPALIFGWYLLCSIILKQIAPPFGKMMAKLQNLEGEYRGHHFEVLSHSEEIAFYNGDKWERSKAGEGFNDLYNHFLTIYKGRFWMGIADSILVKYGAFVIGYVLVGYPVFGPRREEYLKKIGGNASIIVKDYVRNTGLLINLAKAIGKIIVSYKEL